MLKQTARARRHLPLAAASISVIHFPLGLDACLGLESRLKKSTIYFAFYKQSSTAFSYGCEEDAGTGMRLDEFG